MVPDVWLEDDDGEGDEDEVEAAEAVLERHEVEVRVGGGEVDLEVIGGVTMEVGQLLMTPLGDPSTTTHLDEVHVRHVGHHEDDREG